MEKDKYNIDFERFEHGIRNLHIHSFEHEGPCKKIAGNCPLIFPAICTRKIQYEVNDDDLTYYVYENRDWSFDYYSYKYNNIIHTIDDIPLSFKTVYVLNVTEFECSLYDLLYDYILNKRYINININDKYYIYYSGYGNKILYYID